MTWLQDESGADLRTLADNLEDAERTAAAELDEIVLKDPEIKRRPASA